MTDPLLPAVLHTIDDCELDVADFDMFLRSMAMDLDRHRVRDLRRPARLHGGLGGGHRHDDAADPGRRPGGDPAVARESARQLGLAFQLTNFIRDVAEDLDRGRVYLPAEDLGRFGVTPRVLRADASAGARRRRRCDELVAYECERAREHYGRRCPGSRLLEPRSRVCIRAAYLLYGGILDEVDRNGCDVLARRAGAYQAPAARAGRRGRRRKRRTDSYQRRSSGRIRLA